ncbi:MAG: RNA polymerase subunit sigma-70, partial [Peptostreptococcaceae bacterium]|nr:RNA polymerase subunit sigma-70 [Peptostreptococcaceae bacterium]
MEINENNFIKYLKKKNEKGLEYVINNYGWIINST